MMSDIQEHWGFYSGIVVCLLAIGKLIQVIANQSEKISKLELENESKTESLIKMGEFKNNIEPRVKLIENTMTEFRETIAKTNQIVAVALEGINKNISHLTELAEANIRLTNQRLDKLDTKNEQYDTNIRLFWQRGLTEAIDERIKLNK